MLERMQISEAGGGENFDISAEVFRGKRASLATRAKLLQEAVSTYEKAGKIAYLRVIRSAASREVMVEDSATGAVRPMLMFGSNNYLGLTSHPYVKEKVLDAIDKWGTGIGGPPFLNAYSSQTRDLEERIADLKGQEDCLIYSSGYSANLAIASSLFQIRDNLLFDEYSHASLVDGIRLARVRPKRFAHNDLDHLQELLNSAKRDACSDIFVAVEGVYSMDGDVAPLDRIAPICRRAGAMLVVDDAHGTGVLGSNGGGTAEHFGVSSSVDVSMSTFSKALAVTGACISASREIITYLRWLSRPYMFSSALPPSALAAVSAGLDIIQNEPDLRLRLWDNIHYTAESLNALPWHFDIRPQTAIIILPAPPGMNVRRASAIFAAQNIFINPVEYPAVPANQERFRISIMATHEPEDIDRLTEAIDIIWRLWDQGELESDGTDSALD